MMYPEVDIIYTPLSVAEFRERMEPLIRCGYTVFRQGRYYRSLYLYEKRPAGDNRRAYRVVVWPCCRAELDFIRSNITDTMRLIKANMEAVRQTKGPEAMPYLRNSSSCRRTLRRYLQALSWSFGIIEAFSDKSGTCITFCNYYTNSIPPAIRAEAPYPEFGKNFWALADFVKDSFCLKNELGRWLGQTGLSSVPAGQSEWPGIRNPRLMLKSLRRDFLFLGKRLQQRMEK